MFGKHAKLTFLGGIALAASLAVLLVPSAAAHATPGVPVQRPTLHNGLSSEAAQAIEASGFASTKPQSGGLLPSDTTFSWGAAAVGVCIGAGLMLLLGGPRRRVRAA
jgi:hypothetical protein